VIILSTIESPAVLTLVFAKVCDCLWVRTYYAKARSRNRLRMLAGAPSAMTTCPCRRNGHDPGPAWEILTPVLPECQDVSSHGQPRFSNCADPIGRYYRNHATLRGRGV